MSAITDAQGQAATNYHADSAANTAGATGPGSHAAVVQTFVSGTAKQVDTLKDNYLYINITTAAALTIAIGPTSAAATVLNASESDALGLITLFVPAGWYVKLTGTMANLTNTSIAV